MRLDLRFAGRICAALFLGAAAAIAAEKRPNVMVVLADDHATQAVSCYGSGLNATPHIDRLAREGMRFDRCYVTNSICGPSRACILTGKYSHKNGFLRNSDVFDGSQRTFPKILQAAGYQTAVIGKWHLASDPTGFDHWEVLIDQGRYYSPVFHTPGGDVTLPGYATDVVTDRAINWLEEKRAPEKPFLLMVQHKAPHRPWMPGPARLNDFAAREFPEPKTLRDDYKNRASAASKATMRIADTMTLDGDLKLFGPDHALGRELERIMSADQRRAWYATYGPNKQAFDAAPPTGDALLRWKYQRFMQDYQRCIASVDDNVGRLLDYLDLAGLAENTIVAYSSDQGFFLGEHGWFDKRFMYEPSLRMPLVVRWPGVVRPGSIESRIVSNVDFAETILDAAGAEIPADMQGRSFAPLLRGESPPDWRKAFYYQYYEGPPAVHTVAEHYGVTDGRYKLIRYDKLDEWELFDLVSDPEEMTSVYDDPSYAAQRQRLTQELARLQAELEVDPDDPKR